MYQVDQRDLANQIRQLRQTQRGRSAMRHILAWLDDDGLGLDDKNQAAIISLIALAFRYPGSTRDAMREVVGESV